MSPATAAPWKRSQQQDGEDRGRECGIDRNRMEAQGSRRNRHRPGQAAGEAGVAALGEVSEREEGPCERGAGSPGVERGEHGQVAACEGRSAVAIAVSRSPSGVSDGTISRRMG